MKWIKASERLPVKSKSLCCRIHQQDDWYIYFNGAAFDNLPDITNLEWLDESPEASKEVETAARTHVEAVEFDVNKPHWENRESDFIAGAKWAEQVTTTDKNQPT